jgi:ribosomal protein L25 (general stress protein Ctc)
MATSTSLKASERDTTLTPRQLREAGYIPATLYGKGQSSISIQVIGHEFAQPFSQGTREFQLTGFVEGKVKAQQVQREPVSQKPLAIEFVSIK